MQLAEARASGFRQSSIPLHFIEATRFIKVTPKN
jgi:hypothetical protein